MINRYYLYCNLISMTIVSLSLARRNDVDTGVVVQMLHALQEPVSYILIACQQPIAFQTHRTCINTRSHPANTIRLRRDISPGTSWKVKNQPKGFVFWCNCSLSNFGMYIGSDAGLPPDAPEDRLLLALCTAQDYPHQFASQCLNEFSNGVTFSKNIPCI